MERDPWRLLRAAVAFAAGILLIPVVLVIAASGLAIRRILLDAIGSFLRL